MNNDVKVGVIGLGNMGTPMARRLLRAGCDVSVFNRTPERAFGLAREGATLVATTAEMRDRQIVIVILSDAAAIDASLSSHSGLVDEWKSSPPPAGTVLIVMSSIAPDAATRLGDLVSRATAGNASVIDAPVSGGVAAAAAGTLSIMVGATEAQFESVAEVLGILGSTVQLMGPLGSGSLAKACNQLVVAATASALAEALELGDEGGIDAGRLITVFEAGLADSAFLRDKKAMLTSDDYSATGAARLMLKDLRSADSARRPGADLPLAASLLQIYGRLVDDGFGDDDLMVIRRAVRDWSTVRHPG